MKKLVFFLSLAVLFGLISSCGSLRKSSMDQKDDIEIEHRKLNLESHDLSIQDKKLNLDVKAQSYQNEAGGYAQTNNGLWKSGLIINRYLQRKVTYTIIRDGEKPEDGISYDVDGSHSATVANLMIGQYTVIIYEYTVKGIYEVERRRLNVTNKANKYNNGVPYYFIISN